MDVKDQVTWNFALIGIRKKIYDFVIKSLNSRIMHFEGCTYMLQLKATCNLGLTGSTLSTWNLEISGMPNTTRDFIPLHDALELV